ncbi:MAG: VPLPA-CTERM sorting domain-containing protein [Pseudomonadota bacterium]
MSRFASNAFALVVATIVALAAVTAATEAAIVVDARQVGSNVVEFDVRDHGSLDLNGLSFQRTESFAPGISPSDALFLLGPAGDDFDIYSGVTGPRSFGPGGPLRGLRGTDRRFGIDNTGPMGLLAVPAGYRSHGPITSTLTLAGTIESLGLTPGTYQWSWSSDSVTLTIVPLPAALPLLATGVLGLTAVRRWRRA